MLVEELRVYITVFAVFCIPFLLSALCYAATYIELNISFRRKTVPPTVPYYIPLFGNTFEWLIDPQTLLLSAKKRYGITGPARVKLFGSSMYIIQGSTSIKALWKASGLSASTVYHGWFLTHFFGMPRAAVKMYEADDSGFHPQPHSDSNVLPKNRVDYLTHTNLKKFLSGPGSKTLFQRFSDNLAKRLAEVDIGYVDWEESGDFLEFVQDTMTPASIEAMFGPGLLRANPNISRNFWAYDSCIPTLIKGLPWWLAPRAHAARGRVLNSIKQWHATARQSCMPGSYTEDVEYDDIWGAREVRERQEIYLGMHNVDIDGMASADLGAIWSSQSNAVPAAFWCAVEIFRDSSLLHRVREEIRPCILDRNNSSIRFDTNRLVKLPLLRSIYAETLRLRVHTFAPRCFPRDDLDIDGWRLPRNSVCLAAMTPQHLDASIWNTGTSNEYPVDTFWAERFLVIPGDPRSGPLRKSQDQRRDSAYENEQAHFYEGDLTSQWLPYGGGVRACPGRFIAHREIATMCAQLVMEFDIDILAREEDLKMSKELFGLGTLSPKGRVPFRARRRPLQPSA